MVRTAHHSVAVLLIAALFAFPLQAVADDATDGMLMGEHDARANTSDFLWTTAGCLFSFFGLIAAAAVTPSLPTSRLMGKSEAYVASYTDAYKRTAKSIQTKSALLGCLLGPFGYLF